METTAENRVADNFSIDATSIATTSFVIRRRRKTTVVFKKETKKTSHAPLRMGAPLSSLACTWKLGMLRTGDSSASVLLEGLAAGLELCEDNNNFSN